MDNSVYDDDSASSNDNSSDKKCEKYGEKNDTKTKYGFKKCKLTVRDKSIVGNEKTSGGISSGKNKKPKLLTCDKGNDHDYDNSDGGWGSEDETTIQAIKVLMEDLLAVHKNNKIARTTLAQMIDKENKAKRKERRRIER